MSASESEILENEIENKEGKSPPSATTLDDIQENFVHTKHYIHFSPIHTPNS